MATNANQVQSLPYQPTSFVGRQAEIAEVTRLLGDNRCQLLTLVGPGGSGKTRLALEIAARKRHDFANRVFFVALQPLNDAHNIPHAMADTLNFELNGEADPEDQLLAYLADRRLLLVLDNCEHLLAHVHFIADIVQRAPHVKILATSRQPLKLQEEWIIQVDGLAYPETISSEVVGEDDAVQLFADRARQVQADFDLSQQQGAVLRVCRLVEGMPLALELAASWMRTLSCEEIAQEIERSLHFLTSDLRNVAERHRSIQAVFDHSWQLLSQAEQHVLPRLAVFQGGFEREAAEQVADATLRNLSGLVDKSLVRKDRLSGRYDLHELVKQYAAEKLAEFGEVKATSDRHATYYAAFLLGREDDLKSQRQRAALDEIETDFENIRAAWAWALHRDLFDCVSDMLETLNLFGLNRHRYHIEQLMQMGRDKLTHQQDELLYGRLLARSDVERTPQIREKLDVALKIMEQHGENLEIGLCLFYKGWISLHVDVNPQESSRVLEAALAHFERVNDPYYMTRMRVELSIGYSQQGQYAKAAEYAEIAAALARKTGDRINLLWSLSSLEKYAQLRGEYHAAKQRQVELVEISEQLKMSKAARCLRIVLALYNDFASGGFDRARRQLEKICSGTDMAQEPPLFHAWASVLEGMLVDVEGDYYSARTLCEKGESHRLNLAALMACGLGIAAYGLGDYDQIVPVTLPTLKKSYAIDGFGWIAWCLPPYILLLAQEGHSEHAVELLGLAFTHPASLSGWLDKWPLMTRLRADLKAELGEAVYASAWDRGVNSDLKATAARLIHRYDPSSQNTPSSPDALSEREVQILHLVADGFTDKAIAEEVILAVGTVKWYLHQIRQKLGVNNRVQAVKRARELDLL